MPHLVEKLRTEFKLALHLFDSGLSQYEFVNF